MARSRVEAREREVGSTSSRKGIVMLRNPDERAHEFLLDVGVSLELPKGAAKNYSLWSL